MVRLKDRGIYYVSYFFKQFQFLMVRLKGTGIDYHELLEIKFQFLMVRLKVNYFPSSPDFTNTFQFLMVRLKDLYCCMLISTIFRISIPYGAIKRKSSISFKYTYIIISIPYGAIKREKNYKWILVVAEFQFLMVRLKVKPNLKCESQK